MEDLINDTDPELQKLEQQAAAKQSAASESDTEYVDEAEDTVSLMESASELLKNNAVLFEFLANPDYCKTLTKRDRELMLKQADKTYDMAEVLDNAAAALEDEEDDEDEDE